MWLESAPLRPQCRSFFWKSTEGSNLNLFATESRLQRNLAAFALRFREIAGILKVPVGERTEKNELTGANISQFADLFSVEQVCSPVSKRKLGERNPIAKG